ncbi:MAG: sensor histidine kinase, partial [Rhodothermales bacterium]
NDELNALIEQVYLTGLTVEREIDELNRLENYRREFLGNVSHELKTPIFSIRGFAETLLDGALQDDRVNRSFVEKILRNADRISNLAEDLSEVARIETGELKMTVESFSLHRAAREVVESLEPLARAKAVALAYQVPERLPPVAGDPERIRQVLINLVDNAIKYNNAGGHVEVMARLLPSGDIKVSVVDDGIGVAPEHIARLTERFYRVDTSRSRSQGGTGLGLAIVKHILGAHDSRLMIESHPDRGSTFGFLLPTLEEKESG